MIWHVPTWFHSSGEFVKLSSKHLFVGGNLKRIYQKNQNTICYSLTARYWVIHIKLYLRTNAGLFLGSDSVRITKIKLFTDGCNVRILYIGRVKDGSQVHYIISPYLLASTSRDTSETRFTATPRAQYSLPLCRASNTHEILPTWTYSKLRPCVT